MAVKKAPTLASEDDSVPVSLKVFSLSNENCLDCEQTCNSNKPKDLITAGRVKDESCSEVIPTSLSNVKTWSDADNSFLKFVITEGLPWIRSQNRTL